MSVSNKFGPMLVTTGNKSEMSVGYATLYGDMNGGFNPIKDLYKTQVFRLCALAQPLEARRRAGTGRRGDPAKISSQNRRPPNCAKTRRTRIRCRPMTRWTTCSNAWSKRTCASPKLSRAGHDLETVKKIERLLYLAEYKRRQSAPGVKVTRKNFGRDRRYPIVNRFRDSGAPAFHPDPKIAPESPVGVSERFED